MNTENLKLYLNDHLAASVAGIRMAEHCLKNSHDPSLSEFLSGFLSQIKQEQALLKKLIAELGGSQSHLKKAAAWLGEKAAHLKLNYAHSNAGPSRLLELEGLLAGVHAKLNTWRAMEKLSQTHPLFSKHPFASLAQRVEKQLACIEEHCLKAATQAFE